MATILITGGTGMIGNALSKLLADKGHQVIVLTREKAASGKQQAASEQQGSNITYATWDVKAQTIDAEAIKKADHIIHLAGANVAEKRWTGRRKKEIVESRTQSAALIVKALKENENKVKSVISASGIGWYGKDDEMIIKRGGFIETDPADEGFLGSTCLKWEQSIEPVRSLGKRLVILRTGPVLNRSGGMLHEFLRPLNAGFATILGNGKQVLSWIHVHDLCRMYLYAIENEQMNGVYNAVANQPVSNKTFVLEVAKHLRRRSFMPMHVPSFVLKLVLGEMSVEVLKSTTVNNTKIRHAGFKFLYPSLESALNELTTATHTP